MQINGDLKTLSDLGDIHGACSVRPTTGVARVFVSLYALLVSHSIFRCMWLRSVIKMNERVSALHKAHC